MNNGAFGEHFPYTNFHDLNLDWIIETLKKIKEDEEAQNLSIEELKERLEPVEEWIANYSTEYTKELVENYLKTILASMIFVEISDSGYFIYHIPDGWDSIVFNTTGWDINLTMQPEYGHLVLSY